MLFQFTVKLVIVKLIAIFQDKVAKLANYFLSRKHVHQLKAAYQFVSVIKTLADNKVKSKLVGLPLGCLNFDILFQTNACRLNIVSVRVQIQLFSW